MDLKKHLGIHYDSFLSESSSPGDLRLPLASSLPSKLTSSASVPIPIKSLANGIESRWDECPYPSREHRAIGSKTLMSRSGMFTETAYWVQQHAYSLYFISYLLRHAKNE